VAAIADERYAMRSSRGDESRTNWSKSLPSTPIRMPVNDTAFNQKVVRTSWTDRM
jgi:hypothetical protein